MVKPKKSLMVIRLSAMGDVAMMVPVLSALYQKYPEVSITVLTRPFFAPFFRALPNVSVFPVEVYGRHKGILGLYKLSMELKELKIDAIVDLHNVIRSKILRLFFFTKRTVKIDKGRSEKKDLVSGKIFNQLKTTHQRYVDSFKKLGFQIDLSNSIFPKKVVLSQKLIAITGLNPSSKKIIGIAPFAAHEGKKYPLELMEEVIASLSKTHKIVLFGASKIEAPILNTLEARFENVVSVAGKLTLDEELDVISNLNYGFWKRSFSGYVRHKGSNYLGGYPSLRGFYAF